MLFIRPQMVAVSAADSLSRTTAQATIARQQFMGSLRSEIHLNSGQGSYQFVAEHANPVDANDTVELNIIAHDLILFDADGLNARQTV